MTLYKDIRDEFDAVLAQTPTGIAAAVNGDEGDAPTGEAIATMLQMMGAQRTAILAIAVKIDKLDKALGIDS